MWNSFERGVWVPTGRRRHHVCSGRILILFLPCEGIFQNKPKMVTTSDKKTWRSYFRENGWGFKAFQFFPVEFYRFYKINRICGMLFLVILTMKTTESSSLRIRTVRNKKVLLSERKRYTARRVVSTPSVVLTGYHPHPDLARGYPTLVLPSWTW